MSKEIKEGTEVGRLIVKHASIFVGLFETKANKEWARLVNGVQQEDNELEEVLKLVGWQPGWSYCAAFVEAVWRTAYKEVNAPKELQDLIASNLNPSVIKSYDNFKDRISQVPEPGSIFFMQKGFSGYGHAGIVVSSDGAKFATIEGNTSPGSGTAESERNGDGVYKRIRTLDFTKHTYNLHLIGFLNPIRWRRDGSII